MAGEQPAPLSASEAAQQIRDGVLTSEELVQACLERIRALEPKVQAWTFLDAEHALAQARAADERKRSGEPVGPLHGVPVGIKDIIDTGDMPTENGTILHAGRTPRNDAAVVAMLRAAGAVILGKTVTTECAYFAPARPAIRTTPSTPRAARRAAPRPRSRRQWSRLPSAARRTAR